MQENTSFHIANNSSELIQKPDKEYQGEPRNKSLKNGPLEKRGCTDIFCCLVFVLFWVGMIAYSIIALENGDPKILAIPFDIDGNKCGLSSGFGDYKFIYFVKPYPGTLSRTTCLSECPKWNKPEDKPTYLKCKNNSVVPSGCNASADVIIYNTTECKNTNDFIFI